MPNISPRTNSELLRLTHATAIEFSDILQSIMGRGEALDRVVEIIEERVKNETYVRNDDLVLVISKSKSSSLYESVKTQLFKDDWALLKLYRIRYPDPDIESHLSECLYQAAHDDSNPLRHDIVKAMKDVATVDVLPILESILYDHTPSASTKKAIANALASIGGPNLEVVLAKNTARSAESFLKLVAETIDAIRDRDTEELTVSSEDERDDITREKVVRNAHRELERASNYIEANDSIGAMVCLRRGAEAIGKHLYRHLGKEQGGRPANKMMLGDLMKPIKDSDAPEVFKICIQALQPFGNFTNHDQDDQFDYLTPQVVKALIVLYKDALRIYEQWVRQREGRDDSKR